MIITDPVGSCSESFPVQELFDPLRSFPVHAINVGSDVAWMEALFKQPAGPPPSSSFDTLSRNTYGMSAFGSRRPLPLIPQSARMIYKHCSSTRTQEHHLPREKDAMLRHSFMKSKTTLIRNAMMVYFTRMHQTLSALAFARSTSCGLQVEGLGRSGFTRLLTVAQKIPLTFPFFVSLMQKSV